MKRPHVTASLVIVATVVGTAAIYRAAGLALLAVPSGIGLWLAHRRPRAGAGVMAGAAAFVLAIAVAQIVTWPDSVLDRTFDVVNTFAGGVALLDGLRTAFGGNRVTGLAGR